MKWKQNTATWVELSPSSPVWYIIYRSLEKKIYVTLPKKEQSIDNVILFWGNNNFHSRLYILTNKHKQQHKHIHFHFNITQERLLLLASLGLLSSWTGFIIITLLLLGLFPLPDFLVFSTALLLSWPAAARAAPPVIFSGVPLPAEEGLGVAVIKLKLGISSWGASLLSFGGVKGGGLCGGVAPGTGVQALK